MDEEVRVRVEWCPCGAVATTLATDPFYDEGISGDGEITWWCDKCYQQRKDDV